MDLNKTLLPMATGAALVYFLDPVTGERRRQGLLNFLDWRMRVHRERRQRLLGFLGRRLWSEP
jgi:hypothetical protein